MADPEAKLNRRDYRLNLIIMKKLIITAIFIIAFLCSGLLSTSNASDDPKCLGDDIYALKYVPQYSNCYHTYACYSLCI